MVRVPPATTRSQGTFHALQVALITLVLVVPALIGMFWGAPLIAHELETGTFRLAWTQSVSRRRWLWVKMGLVGLASALTAGLLSLMSTWWFSPIDKVSQNRFSPASFGLHGFVPAGYAAFAFALGVTAGLLFRRTLPAMAVTLVGFVASPARGHLLGTAALHEPGHPQRCRCPAATSGSRSPAPGTVSPVSMVANPPDLPNAWVTSAAVVNNAGQAPSSIGRRRTPAPIWVRAWHPPPASGGLGPLGGHAFGVRVSQAGTTAVQRLHLHPGHQVPRRRGLPAGQPVLDVPGNRNGALRGSGAGAWPVPACGGSATG